MIFLAACTGRENANVEERKVEYAAFIDNPTEISFDEMVFDFGKVKDAKRFVIFINLKIQEIRPLYCCS